MKQVIPTVFSHDKQEFDKRFRKMTSLSKLVQIDLMDGKFVSSKSISLSSIPDLRKYKNSFEAHLMVKNPEKWIKAVSEKGFRKMIFHIEAVRSSRKAEEIISRIKEYEMIPYIAINSDTPLNRIIPLIKSNKIENLLVMGGHAGKEHQKLNAKTPQRIKKLKRLNSKLFIQIDMGVNNETASLLKEADALNSGSFVAGSKNPKKALALLKKTFMDNSGD